MIALFFRDLKLSVRAGGGAMIGVLFFMTVVAVIPFGVGPDLNLLARIGPAILWIGALLASLLGLDRLFQAEREDGSLDLIMMQETPLLLAVLVKCAAHWTATGLPLVIASPFLGLFMNMDEGAIGATMVTLLAGTPAITFIGAVGAAVAGGAAARRPARLDPRPAACHTGAHLRRQRGLCGNRGSGPVSAAFHDIDGDNPVLRGDRTSGGRGGTQALGRLTGPGTLG
ncbi:heme exporter protein CcmB [Sinorhizobium meliloti]